MKLTTIAAALLLAAPVQAQELTPSMLMTYAQLGAVNYSRDQYEKGNYARACIALRHLQKMEAETNEPPESIATTTRMINNVCGSGY